MTCSCCKTGNAEFITDLYSPSNMREDGKVWVQKLCYDCTKRNCIICWGKDMPSVYAIAETH